MDQCIIKASENNEIEDVKRLLEAGADPNFQDKCGSTALIWASKTGNIEIVRVLFEAGADLNLQNRWGNTALIIASRYTVEETVKILLEAGADPNIQNRWGNTALELALSDKNNKIVDLLQNYYRSTISYYSDEPYDMTLRRLMTGITMDAWV